MSEEKKEVDLRKLVAELGKRLYDYEEIIYVKVAIKLKDGTSVDFSKDRITDEVYEV